MMEGSPATQRRLERFSTAGFNFNPATFGSSDGYGLTDESHPLPPEAPGPPEPGGSWDIARRLIANYEFADPRVVRAFFDPAAPLLNRTMVLQLRALNLFRVYVGVRILAVSDETREVEGRPAQIWGWTYGTLRGHVESGEMSWETWKWLDSGEVEFRVHALSRPARIRNPFTRIGFAVLGPHERTTFLHSSGERMNRLIRQALSEPRAQHSAASADGR